MLIRFVRMEDPKSGSFLVRLSTKRWIKMGPDDNEFLKKIWSIIDWKFRSVVNIGLIFHPDQRHFVGHNRFFYCDTHNLYLDFSCAISFSTETFSKFESEQRIPDGKGSPLQVWSTIHIANSFILFLASFWDNCAIVTVKNNSSRFGPDHHQVRSLNYLGNDDSLTMLIYVWFIGRRRLLLLSVAHYRSRQTKRISRRRKKTPENAW